MKSGRFNLRPRFEWAIEFAMDDFDPKAG